MAADQTDDSLKTDTKLPYPKSIWFIVGNEFCERFSYYGMKAILTLYISEKLHYSEDSATGIYHAWSALCYFMPIFGAIIADSWLGKFKTIWIISIIYVLGHLFKTLAAIPPLGLPPAEFSFIGLALIAVGTGGIKPCVSAFGGDQFKLPEQERQLQTFFSVFYFSINAGSLISTALTPILRQDVKCFGDDSCFSLAFGVPAVLMAIATVILVVGKPFYNIKPPQGNIITSVVGAIFHGIKGKLSNLRGGEKKEHWLDYAKGKYSEDLVDDTKSLLRVLKIFLPIPVFWALFDQTGSRWTFQAVRTTGQLGTFLIKPDQMQVFNPLMILILIPLFDRFIYPQFAKIGLLKDPIQRIIIGGCLTGVAFFVSGFLELSLEPTYGVVPKYHESHMHIINSMDCLISVRVPGLENKEGKDSSGEFHRGIEAKANLIIQNLKPGQDYTVSVKSGDQDPPHCRDLAEKEFVFNAGDKVTTEYVIVDKAGQINAIKINQDAKPSNKKSSNSNPSIRMVLAYDDGLNADVRLHGDDHSNMAFENVTDSNGAGVTEYQAVFPQNYGIWVSDIKLDDLVLKQGAVYSLVVVQDPEGTLHLQKYLLTVENTVHMLWLIPQYLIITCGEVMLSITGLEFSYSQAPASMKSVVQACWLLTVAFGNIIVFIIAESHIFETQAPEFFMFGSLIFVAMVWLWFLGRGFKYANRSEDQQNTEEISLEEKSQ